jgi:hypothetical protein
MDTEPIRDPTMTSTRRHTPQQDRDHQTGPKQEKAHTTMTTRLAKTSRTARTPVIALFCPACRAIRKCKPIGSGSVGGKRREIVQCGEPSCELAWVPQRTQLVDTPQAA